MGTAVPVNDFLRCFILKLGACLLYVITQLSLFFGFLGISFSLCVLFYVLFVLFVVWFGKQHATPDDSHDEGERGDPHGERQGVNRPSWS